MGTSIDPALRRARRIQRRSTPGAWGPKFEPAIRGNRSEGPSVSRISQINCGLLGRRLHALSAGEQEAILLALYNPTLLDLHEQRPLSPQPSSHPLQSHPLMSGQVLPTLSGTLAIANKLGLLSFHPKAWVPSTAEGADAASGFWAPSAWIGDLLLYLQDSDGPYCVHWDVKRARGITGSQGPASASRRVHAQSELQLLATRS